MKEPTTLKISNLKADLANMKEDTARKEIADQVFPAITAVSGISSIGPRTC